METVLVLRCVHADMSSSREFVWPASGPVEAPDWIDGGTAQAGDGGAINIQWRDGTRWRTAVAETGTSDCLADTPYHVVNGKLTRKNQP